MTNKALILGCQRSGTTLLGMILQAHSSVEVIEENNGRFHQIYALTRLLDLARVDSYQSTDAKLAVFKAPRDSHRICEIEQTLPQAKTIWVSREVNQVVASMLSLKTQGGVPWALQFAEKEVIKYLYTTLGSFQIADGLSWAVSQPETRTRAVALSTLCWLVKRLSERKAANLLLNRFHLVSYEMIVIEPASEIRALLTFLGLPWEDRVLQHNQHISGTRPGGSLAARPIDTRSIESWRRMLTQKDQQVIAEILNKFGE